MQALLDAPRQDLTESQVLSAIRSPSPLVRWHVDILEPNLADTEERLRVNMDAGGTIDYAYRPSQPDARATDTTINRLTGTLTVDGSVSDSDLLSHLFRPTLTLKASDGTDVPFYTGVFTSALPSSTDNGEFVSRQLTMAAREHLWSTAVLDDWTTVTPAEDVFTVIRADLSDVFGVTADRLPLFAQESAVLTEQIDFEPGTAYAEKWTRLLAAIGYDRVTTTADGYPTTVYLADVANAGPSWTYAPSQGRIVVPGRTEPLDPELPNVVRVESRNAPDLAGPGNGWVTIRNQSTGPASIDQRGYEVFKVVMTDSATQTELEAYAAAERVRLFAGGGLRFNGHIGLNPLHGNRDTIELVRPRLGLSGVWNLTGWSLPVGRVNRQERAVMSISAEARVA